MTVILPPPRSRRLTHDALTFLVRWAVWILVGLAITLALVAGMQLVFAFAHVA